MPAPAERTFSSGPDLEDIDIAEAERDAYPERFHDYDPAGQFHTAYDRLHPEPSQIRSESHTQARDGPAAAPTEQAEQADDDRRDGGLERTETVVSSCTASSASRPQPRHRSTRQMSTVSKIDSRLEREFMDYIDRHPTALARMSEHRLQHSHTVGTGRSYTGDGVELPDFGAGKPYPPPLPDREEYVVEFSGHNDPRHAQNWPMSKKVYIGAILAFQSLAATFASSIFSAGSQAVGREFHVGEEVVTLGTSLFVLGYVLGPMIFAPISELYGRRLPIIVAAFGFGIFNTGVAVAKDYQTLTICRFFAGVMGAAPLSLTAAVFADMLDNKLRGIGVAIFSGTVIMGPLCGPMVGGFITKSTLGWRFTAWFPAFMGYIGGILCLFFQEESYGPVILVSKAAELRRLTRNWGIHAKQDEVEVDIKELVIKNLSRPLRILFTEPIVLLVTIYMSFIYGLLYLTLTAYSLVFAEVHGFSLGVEGLPFIGMIVGVALGVVVVVLMNGDYVKKLDANNNIPVPEWRMPIVMVGGVLFTIGLFWFGWTGYLSSIPWIVPTLAGLALGFGLYTIFLQCLNYIIDSYLMFAASAIAANTIMRSLFGAVFPLFASYMFKGIGIQWGMTLLGCVAALFIPMPFVFYFYGKKIRAKSKFAPAPDITMDKKRDEEARTGGDGDAGAGADADAAAGADARREDGGATMADPETEKNGKEDREEEARVKKEE